MDYYSSSESSTKSTSMVRLRERASQTYKTSSRPKTSECPVELLEVPTHNKSVKLPVDEHCSDTQRNSAAPVQAFWCHTTFLVKVTAGHIQHLLAANLLRSCRSGDSQHCLSLPKPCFLSGPTRSNCWWRASSVTAPLRLARTPSHAHPEPADECGK